MVSAYTWIALVDSPTSPAPMKLLDHYSEFRRAFHTCKHCGWSGTGAMMKNGRWEPAAGRLLAIISSATASECGKSA